MLRHLRARFLLASLLLLTTAATSGIAHATQVWSGRTFAFAKAANADFTQAINQDRITPLVWITRGNTMGIFNIAQESAFAMNVSPKDTEWATGDAVNHASLTFKTWQVWTNNNPPATVGVNAVVHLITDDIYLDIRFDSFGASGGAFSYHRAVDPATPTTRETWGRIKALYR